MLRLILCVIFDTTNFIFVELRNEFVTFERRTLASMPAVDWKNSKSLFTKLHVTSEGTIEAEGSGFAHVSKFRDWRFSLTSQEESENIFTICDCLNENFCEMLIASLQWLAEASPLLFRAYCISSYSFCSELHIYFHI